MESFCFIPLLIFVLLLILLPICIILFLFIKKVKMGWLWLLTILVLIIGGVKIHNRIIDSVLYDFKEEICESYPEIDNIELDMFYLGRYGSINVYIEKEIDDGDVENIFLYILKKINQEPMSSYLKGSTNRKNKSWVELQICFCGKNYERFDSGPNQHSDWFTEENQQEQTWENNDTGKLYRYSDYIK